MSLYSYYIDAPNYAGASIETIRSNINDIMKVVDNKGEYLCYLHADKDAWLAMNDVNGLSLSCLWESDDRMFLNALTSLLSQHITNCGQAFMNPDDMDRNERLKYSYNAFWGVDYGPLGPDNRYLDCYDDHLLFCRQCAATDIWKNREVYFSKIKFAPDLERQLNENKSLASAILNVLCELDEICCTSVSVREFNYGLTKAGFTDESDSVKHNPAFKKLFKIRIEKML